MKGTVCIMTSEESFENNYGAALQGYALYTTLKQMGYLPAIIRYTGGEFKKNKYLYTLFCLKRSAGKLYRRILRPKNKKPGEIVETDGERRRKELFLSFQRKYMTFVSDKRLTYHQLEAHPPVSDFYVCGSDQIWNPFFKEGRNDPGYFLAFAPKGTVKIAYAPSFGCSDLPDQAKSDIAHLLSDFRAVSVREKTGVDIVKKYAHREAKLVLDPTMLLSRDQWNQVAAVPDGIPEKYILCYRFADSEKTKSMIDGISRATGIPVLSLPLSKVAQKDNYVFVYDAGPAEFVGLIRNASLVCTDSFHATVFSILMGTPVCVFLRESFQSGESMNSRIYSLLETLSLQQLIIQADDSLEKMIQNMDVNYENAYAVLNKLKGESEAFLLEALK